MEVASSSPPNVKSTSPRALLLKKENTSLVVTDQEKSTLCKSFTLKSKSPPPLHPEQEFPDMSKQVLEFVESQCCKILESIEDKKTSETLMEA